MKVKSVLNKLVPNINIVVKNHDTKKGHEQFIN